MRYTLQIFLQWSVLISFFSQIMVGEHVLGVDPDCTKVGGFAKLCNPNKIKMDINKVILHQGYICIGLAIKAKVIWIMTLLKAFF